MKKILVFFLSAVLALGIIVPVYADDESNKLEISFKVGDEILSINGKDVQVQKPYVVNGVTLVPLRVITEAFGADVTWNAEDSSITLEYGSVKMKLVTGSKTAVVNGVETEMQEAPANNSGTTMVPLRFITENFGANVSYDQETKQITVVKDIAGSNSIRDFGLILKKSTKDKIGDSYYKWSVSFPKQLEIAYRAFDGTYSRFTAEDDSYTLYVSVRSQTDETIDSIMAEELDYASDYTILSHEKPENEEGQEYIRFSYKDDTSAYEDRIFINDEKIYEIDLWVKEYKNYVNNSDFKDLMDSFKPEFIKDGTTEDLSDVNSRGFRTYEDKNLKWKIDVPAQWDFYLDSDKTNEVEFMDASAEYSVYGSSVNVKMYSMEEGMTLDKFVEKELQEINDYANPELVKVLENDSITVNGVEGRKLLTSVKYGEKTVYLKNIYLFGENYRYSIWYNMPEDEYNKTAEKSKLENILRSFKFSEPDAESVGALVDPNSVELGSSVRNLQNSDNKWYVEIPSSWTATSSNDGKTTVSYSYDKYQMMFTLSALKDQNLQYDAYVSYYEGIMEAAKSAAGPITGYKTYTLNDKGTTIKKYENNFKINDIDFTEYYYIISKNGCLYTVSMLIIDICKSEKNLRVFDDIWQSLKFE